MYVNSKTGERFSVRRYVAMVSPRGEPLPQFSFTFERNTGTMIIKANENTYIIHGIMEIREKHRR